MQSHDLVGQMLGNYRVIRSVGYGGMATVFLAEDIHLRREVAVKVFSPRPGESADFFRRFAREARVLAQLDHPNILPVYDYGEQDGLAYLIMPYMSCGSLSDLLKVHRILPIIATLRLTAQILNALQYAHERGLIHRDIKPGNMLLKADGNLLLSDFGLVKVLVGDDDLKSLVESVSQSISGTPAYMAPEQALGQATPLSDLYSVGVVLYEMLTGTVPFVADTTMGVLFKHTYEQPRPLRQLNPNISPQLEAVVLHAIEKDPAKRYQQPSDFLQALIQGSDSEEVVNMLNWSGSTFPPTPPYTPMQALTSSSTTPDNTDSKVDEKTSISPRQSAQPPYATLPISSTATPIATQTNVEPLTLTSPSPGQYTTKPQRIRHVRPSLLQVAILLLIAISLLVGLVVSPPGQRFLGISHSPPNKTGDTSTASMPPTLTSCPQVGTSRAAIMAPLALGTHQNIVYIDNEAPNTTSIFGILKRYDVTTGNKTEIVKMQNSHIDEAQVSRDGEWVLFIAHVLGQPELRLVRMDGQGLQTLHCATPTTNLSAIQWSPNQKLLVFNEGGAMGGPTVYLLDITNGKQQPELVPSMGYISENWLDNTRVYLTGFIPNADFTGKVGLFILDTKKGENQHDSDLQQIVKLSQLCWDFANSRDSSKLFVSQCNGASGMGGPSFQTGPSTITTQSATDGQPKTIYSNPKIAVTAIHMITNTSLLLTIDTQSSDASIDTSQNGLWKMNTDGSNLTQVTSVVGVPTISPFGGMYALEVDNFQLQTQSYSLLFGSLSGDILTTFDSLSNVIPITSDENMPNLTIVGWTTM